MGKFELATLARIGGSNRFVVLLTFSIHFLHLFLCLCNYIDWVQYQGENDLIPNRLVPAYLAMVILGISFYVLIVSVFYMWAWRYPEPEETSKQRRIIGIIINLIFCDIPIFIVEVILVWAIGFATPLQALSFLFTCFSLAYSGLRSWTFLLVKAIKTCNNANTSSIPGLVPPVMVPASLQEAFEKKMKPSFENPNSLETANPAPNPVNDRPVTRAASSLYPPNAGRPNVLAKLPAPFEVSGPPSRGPVGMDNYYRDADEDDDDEEEEDPQEPDGPPAGGIIPRGVPRSRMNSQAVEATRPPMRKYSPAMGDYRDAD